MAGGGWDRAVARRTVPRVAARPAAEREGPAAGRDLAWPLFLVVVVVYAAIIQAGGLLLGVDTDRPYPSTEALVRNVLIPIALSVLFAAAVATWLAWWGEIVRSDRPVQRWVRIVPISMLVAALVAIDYGHLADVEVGLVLCLAALVVLVGVGEELMFRGIGVNVFRRGGFSEGRVALYSSIVFGAVHVTNAIGDGTQAVVQAAVVSTSGYLFYICLRAGGVILVPMLVHGLWDGSLLSSRLGPDPTASPATALIIVVQMALIGLVVVRRHRIEP